MSMYRRTLTALLGLLATLAAFTVAGTAAYARPAPAPDGPENGIPVPTSPTVSVITTHSTSWWVLALVAVIGAALTAAAVLGFLRLRRSAQPSTVHA